MVWYHVPMTWGPYQAPQPGQWRCPFCGYVGQPSYGEKTSGAGWAIFVVLLLLCFCLCWLGLLIRERYRYCPNCGQRF